MRVKRTIITLLQFVYLHSSDPRNNIENNSNIIDVYIDINVVNCIVGSMGVAKQQSDLKRSFLQIYQIDRSIFVDCCERVKKNTAIKFVESDCE